ncbi:DUF4365 domain-containing protein [Streptomyces armeniacus]|uniref:DUF4365 domain-containing protein n=2 Tax=Streptomyces armeniacus TaxID=83291 RepID=A0A345XZN0_9ACTN|nr:DUF4365 domain-containing protein [Streptomyces armeniacus]
MGDNGHKGDFGEQFVRALAAVANLDASRRDRDRVGVDWQLGYPGRHGTRRYPSIDVQVKCWAPSHAQPPDTWHYPLRGKNYNWLAGRDYQLPRFLFLVVVPDKAEEWVHVSAENLLLRHAAYWACFHDKEPDCPDKSSRMVYVPRTNLLTVGALHDLFTDDFREMLVAS